ncbi:MRN complex-interacting protein [Phoenix dactylifera]|uniref:MRN complex-interacting protein n=1 Tax=Phoenix dactylifera TaxID=42345 RepID=A0A8B9ABB5_PHODC|nr:MRN complex-interacting protein [Phoenix dactylifera]
MSTLFIAVQCFHCSTMQVKQQKKGSNKWVCAVCNQRQSVRRIHAQGPLARDLRHFVQAFNMSRSDGSHPIPPPSEGSRSPMAAAEHGGGANRGKRRMDWTEYLDPQKEKDDGGGGAEPEMVTELPPKMLRRHFSKCSPWMQLTAAGKEKPNFSKKRKDAAHSQGRIESRGGCISVAAKGQSRWSEYLEEFDGCSQGEEFTSPTSGQEPWGGRENLLPDMRVEDEVHPDFQ